MSMDFLDDFDKELEEMEGVGTSSAPPRYWYTTSNYALNRIISGSFYKGIPQGRVTNLAGPAGAGKSFVAANIAREAQHAGAFVYVVDTENALDDEFMRKIGVNTDKENYRYAGVTTINQAIGAISTFLKKYKQAYKGDLAGAPQILIILDSMDMLMTDTELEHYDEGIQKGDQGQKNKQLKAMLKTFIQDVKPLNVAMIVTSQVYRNQDLRNGEGLWIISDAVKYSASQIVLLTKTKLKEKEGVKDVVTGINMRCEGVKTRFTKPFQHVYIEVPYDVGMDPYSGLKEATLELGVLEKHGSWYAVTGETEKWYWDKEYKNHVEKLLIAAEAKTDAFLRSRTAEELEDDGDEGETKEETAIRRKAKYKAKRK